MIIKLRPGWTSSGELWVVALITLLTIVYLVSEFSKIYGLTSDIVLAIKTSNTVLAMVAWLFATGPFLTILFEIKRNTGGESSASRYAGSKHINRIERNIRSAIEEMGTGRKALKKLQQGLFRNLHIVQVVLSAIAIVGLLGMLFGVFGFAAAAVCYWLNLFPTETVELVVGHPIFGQVILYAVIGMGLSTCLLPLIIILQRSGRLISDFTQSILDVREDGKLAVSDKEYAVYLRSFTAEQYYLEQTYTMRVGFEGGVRQQIHPGFFIKQSIARLKPDLLLVEALNLSEQTTAENFEHDTAKFKKICLFEFNDWDLRVKSLCEAANFIFLHLDDTSDGLQQEVQVVEEFASKTVIFGPKSFPPVEQLSMPNSRWLAVIKYQSEFADKWQQFPEEIVFLNATVASGSSVKDIKYEGQWLREFLHLHRADRLQ